MIEPISAKASLRVLLFLKTAGDVKLSKFKDGSTHRIMLSGLSGDKMISNSGQLDALHKASLISLSSSKCSLLATGEKRIKRAMAVANGADDNGFADQHRHVVQQQQRVNGVMQNVKINANESPLHRLKTRKGANGEAWINDAAFEAGERLRMDFTRGQLNPKVTSSWDPTTAQTSGAGGKVEISDNAIDARSRMERALEHVGPDLAGVLTDVCCFLKGLESVERERRWPPRSAKLMLRTGLDLLARHYGTAAGVGRKKSVAEGAGL